MIEAEISPEGAVLVEGHHVGELQGFRFTADASAGGEDAKAVKAAAQKALAAEFDRRAERFALAPNGDFALGSDGIVRWIGAPMATLTAGDSVLKPRLVLFADEQLTGPSRDKVVERAERFVTYQVETLLKPLVELAAAAELEGMARGIAFRLVESFGSLNRRDVIEDVRGLDQDARGALRRLGVRFGAYHIFIPSLLKPAPAGLLTLLWALQNDGKDKPGFGDVVNALATGRTSLVTDASFATDFYKLGGFRNLGRRAVRFDILERLADLIRVALAFKPGAGTRPDGAVDGRAFTVTAGMMSILGATPEDMEQILKALGYRADPKQAAEYDDLLTRIDAHVVQAPAAKDASATEADVAVDVSAETAVTAGEAVAAETTDRSSDVTENAAIVDDKKAAQPSAGEEAPKVILLWRQGRSDDRQARGNRQNAGNRNQGRNQRGQDTNESQQQRREGNGADKRRDTKPQRDRNHQRPNRDGGRDKPQGNRPQKPREEKPVRIDPDSPFAKLAALKAKLGK